MEDGTIAKKNERSFYFAAFPRRWPAPGQFLEKFF
jgi:hypothetical protein